MDAEERELMPGVYVTDFRASPPSSSTSTSSTSHEHKQSTSTSSSFDEKTSTRPQPPRSSPSPLPSTPSTSLPLEGLSDVSQLTFDLAALRNSLDHLIASNAEMVTAMEEEGDEDGVYGEALRDNMLTIERQQRKADELQRLIEDALAGHAIDKPTVLATAPSISTQPSPLPPSSSAANGEEEGGMYL